MEGKAKGVKRHRRTRCRTLRGNVCRIVARIKDTVSRPFWFDVHLDAARCGGEVFERLPKHRTNTGCFHAIPIIPRHNLVTRHDWAVDAGNLHWELAQETDDLVVLVIFVRAIRTCIPKDKWVL